MPHARQPTIAPFGTWTSPLDSEAVYRKRSSVTELLVDKITGDVFQIKSRPDEAGRCVLMRTFAEKDGGTQEEHVSLPVVPSSSNVRAKVHEYGGGAARVHGGVAYWNEAKDGRIYRRKVGKECHKHRFADFDIHPSDNNLLICIEEDHTDETQVTNGLILINLKYATMQEIRPARVDGFYAFPRFGGIHGDKIAWIEWKHPDMPWDGTELYYSAFSIPTSKQPIQLCPIKIAGKRSEISINDIKWDVEHPDKMYFLSNQTGYVNLWFVDLARAGSQPQWASESLPYDLDRSYDKMNNEYCGISNLHRVSQQEAIFSGGKYDSARKVVLVTLGTEAGGPTSRNPPTLSLLYQYFTTRGFAILDVDYGGSSGYGREYQGRLNGRWGEVDVYDVIRAVEELDRLGKIDKERVAIRGSSAGGYTALACLTDSKVFSAGVSLYGISDVRLLAQESHKVRVIVGKLPDGEETMKAEILVHHQFESHYVVKLMGGTLDKRPEIYAKRSPVTKVMNIQAELLMMQGLQDKILSPNQTRLIVKKLEGAGRHVETIYYPDEGHGMKKSGNLTDSLMRTEKFLKKALRLDR